jgi:L-alanine-DL-glutamate epimerase-like enolase superfamily enzyme
MSKLHLEAEVQTLRTKHPFIIARGGKSEYRTVVVKLRDSDGLEGWGEAAGITYYGESPETILSALQTYATVLPESAFDLETAERGFETALKGNPSARAALSAALHDIVGKRFGIPVWKLWGLDPQKAPKSTFTIGLDTVEKMQGKVKEAEQYPILKIKLGTDHDLQILQGLREVTKKELRVDANCGWTVKQTVQMLPILEEFGVTVLEQPLDPRDLEGLSVVRKQSSLPLIADESCLVASDIPRLAGKVDGINIKLAKCGSLREALRMIHVARAHGMMVMVGCMIESSLAISAAAHFTPLVDIVDLDGAALLAEDPFIGATITGGQVTLPEGPGLGVRKR